jgi:hypothetical protein
MSFPSSIPPSRTEEDKERIQQTVIQHKNAKFLSDDSVLLPKTGKVVEETSSKRLNLQGLLKAGESLLQRLQPSYILVAGISALQEQIMLRCKYESKSFLLIYEVETC